MEQMLIVSTIWKVLCDTFHNVESTICISTMWKLQFVFPQCGNYNVNFTLRTKKGLRFSTKLKVKWFLLHNVQGENRAVKALKWSATESCIQLVWMPWNDSLPCQKWLKSRIICFAKCQKSRYFCGRILAQILCSRKVFEVFHVWATESSMPISKWRN